MDHFCGLLRSTVECAACGSRTTQFDPFSTLELELADEAGSNGGVDAGDDDDESEDVSDDDDDDDAAEKVAAGAVVLARRAGPVAAPPADLPDDRRGRVAHVRAAARIALSSRRVALAALSRRPGDPDDEALAFAVERPFLETPASRCRFGPPELLDDRDAFPETLDAGGDRVICFEVDSDRVCLVADGDAVHAVPYVLPASLYEVRFGFRRLHGLATSRSRRRRDSTDCPLRGRGVAATLRTVRVVAAAASPRLHGLSASSPRRHRDSTD